MPDTPTQIYALAGPDCAWDYPTRIAINADAEARIAALEVSLPFAISRHLSTICSHLLGLYDASGDPKVRELAVAIRACMADAGEAFAAALAAKATVPDALAKLAEIPPAGSEERGFWLEAADQHGFELVDRDRGWNDLYEVEENSILTLMSEARKQGQRDILGATPMGSGSHPSDRTPSGSVPTGFDPSRGAELERLSAAATQGTWHLDMFPYRDVETGKEEPPRCEGICTHDEEDGLADEVATCGEPDARFIVTLVNAYRAGHLVFAALATGGARHG